MLAFRNDVKSLLGQSPPHGNFWRHPVSLSVSPGVPFQCVQLFSFAFTLLACCFHVTFILLTLCFHLLSFFFDAAFICVHVAFILRSVAL